MADYEVWYVVDGNRIEAVRIVGSTALTVMVLNEWGGLRRAKKSGSYERYFPTFDEAKTFLVDRAERRLASARLALSRCQGEYGNAKGAKVPELPKMLEKGSIKL